MTEKKQLNLFKVFMSPDVIQPLNDVLMSGFITQGPMVEKFEEKLSEYFGNKHVLTLNSATSGLTLALRLLLEEDSEDCWPGFNTETDVVLSPALTCFATNAAILANNCNICLQSTVKRKVSCAKCSHYWCVECYKNNVISDTRHGKCPYCILLAI